MDSSCVRSATSQMCCNQEKQTDGHLEVLNVGEWVRLQKSRGTKGELICFEGNLQLCKRKK